MKDAEGEELKYANDYWAYIRNVLAGYVGKGDNDGKRIVEGNAPQSGQD